MVRSPLSIPRSRTAWLFAAVLASVFGASAVANASCKEVFFTCDLGERDAEGGKYLRTVNLKNFRAGGRSDAWIAKRCEVSYADPPGCSWRGGGSSGGSGGGGTVVLTSGGYSAPSAPSAASASPAPARRDAWGRRSPTPAPARDGSGEGASQALADDGPYASEIAQAASRYRLPPQLVRAVMQVESGSNPLVVSHKGAVGLMQLLPATAAALGVEDIHDPAQNILGGARFLRVLANKFEGDLVKVLSAYHAGSMRVLSRDATPFAATDDYVRKVLKTYYQLRDAALRDGATRGAGG